MKRILIFLLTGAIILLFFGFLYYGVHKNVQNGKVPDKLREIYIITKMCQNFRLASVLEWEQMGFVVNGDIARGNKMDADKKQYQVEFNITVKELCFDEIHCTKECNGALNTAMANADSISGVLLCYCLK